MILRFVPYIGAILAASLPIALAAAVGSDWSMSLWTIALFAVMEPLTGQVVEPLVCGTERRSSLPIRDSGARRRLFDRTLGR
jgi:predicted PurR-regulated permease PerM